MTADKNIKPQIYHLCAACDRDTWHVELFSHEEQGDPDYRIDVIHQVVQCCGCRGISFRKVIRDIEGAYPVDDDEWDVPEEVFSFPKTLKGHRELEDIWSLPDSVREIYTQSIKAIKDDLNIIAGIGLRATIEAICNEQKIGGKILDKRIDALAKGGLISQKDAERLHAIRFLGNDAAHEIKNASRKNLLIAVRIIEHLLVNIYILDNEADGKLDTIIRSSEVFIELLNDRLKVFSSGDEYPLAKFFGKDMRRFHGHFSALEKDLIDRISSNNYKKLLVGKLDVYAGSKDKLQHFVVK